MAGGLDGGGVPVPKVLIHRRDHKDKDVERAPTTPGMKYHHYSPTDPDALCTHSIPPQDTVPTSPCGYFSSSKSLSKTPIQLAKLGVLPSSNSLQVFAKDVRGVEFYHFLLGSVSDPPTVVQRLFVGFLSSKRLEWIR